MRVCAFLRNKWLKLIDSNKHYEIQKGFGQVQLRLLPEFDCMADELELPSTYEVIDSVPYKLGMEKLCGMYCGDNLIHLLEEQ